MPKSYRAVLVKGRLRWIDAVPEALRKGRGEVWVRVTIEKESATDGDTKASVLDELAEADPFADIDDPVEWQREIRRDRGIPD